MRTYNFFVGIISVSGGFLTIIPLTIELLTNLNFGFNFGLLLLPIYIPLFLSLGFGIITTLAYYYNYNSLKLKIYTLLHIIIAIIGSIACLIIPIIPTILIGLPLTIIMLYNLTYKNLENQLLIMNSLVICCEIAVMTLELSFGRNIPLLNF